MTDSVFTFRFQPIKYLMYNFIREKKVVELTSICSAFFAWKIAAAGLL